MIRLSERQVISVHSAMIKATGGIDGLRDEKLLNSALNTPFQTFDSKELYPSLLAKAAALCRSIYPITRLQTATSAREYTLC